MYNKAISKLKRRPQRHGRGLTHGATSIEAAPFAFLGRESGSVDRYDVLLMLGIVLVTIGCSLVYVPLGLIAGGVGCIALAVIGARGNNIATSGNEKVKT